MFAYCVSDTLYLFLLFKREVESRRRSDAMKGGELADDEERAEAM